MTDLRRIIRAALDRRGISISEIARRADAPRPTVSRWLSRSGRRINTDQLERLLGELGLRVIDPLDDDE